MTLQSIYIEADPEPQEVSPELQEQRNRRAFRVCFGALDLTSWLIADRLARSWGCGGCASLGAPRPSEKQRIEKANR